jgi:sugar O-acyltransferase (sialic acid O-acetyltransferase NeuD family)
MTAVPLVVIGGGGHAKVVLDVLRLDARFRIVGVVDPARVDGQVLEFPVLGGDEILPALRAQGVTTAFVALGDNRTRQRIGRELRQLGFALPAIVHPTAIISPSARIEAGSVIMAGAKVGPDASVGELAIVNTGAIVEHDVQLGPAAHVAPGCSLAGCVRVGERTLLGVGSVVRPDIRIGDDVVVGAGSAVVADVKNEQTVAGVPARRLPKRATNDVAA